MTSWVLFIPLISDQRGCMEKVRKSDIKKPEPMGRGAGRCRDPVSGLRKLYGGPPLYTNPLYEHLSEQDTVGGDFVLVTFQCPGLLLMTPRLVLPTSQPRSESSDEEVELGTLASSVALHLAVLDS